MSDLTINIEGMTCNHCKMSVTKALNGVTGVESVEVSVENKNAHVKGSQLNKDEIINAVKNAGYEAVIS